MIPWNSLKSTLERDPEFRYTIRHWTASLRLSVGDRHVCVRFEDGAVAALEPCEADTPSDVFLAGPDEEWRELLRKVPRPFYQDPFFASVHHGIEMNHDQLAYAAYYPALRRLVQVDARCIQPNRGVFRMNAFRLLPGLICARMLLGDKRAAA